MAQLPSLLACCVVNSESFGNDFTLPLDPSAFSVAKFGVHKLKSKGEEVVDPDYVAQWTVNQPG